jgi:hypothetical protein
MLTFGQFQAQRETDRLTALAVPLYDLVILVYSYAGLLVEAESSDETASAGLLRSLIQLLNEQGLLVIADRSISPQSPNQITIALKDIHKLLGLAVMIDRAAWFFRISLKQFRCLLHDLLRIQQEPGWKMLETVHHEAAFRGQQLARLVETLRTLPSVGYQVVDFGGNWVLLAWKQ